MADQITQDYKQSLLAADREESDNDRESEFAELPSRRGKQRRRWQLSLFRITSFLVVGLLSVMLGVVLGRYNIDFDKECAAYTAEYCKCNMAPHLPYIHANSLAAPLLKDVKIRYETIKFNGSFLAESIYRQPPSPEVDAAWNALGIDNRPVVITPSEGLKAGLSKHYNQVSQKYGGGYVVGVQGLHSLHCVDVLRKGLWYNYEYYKVQGQNSFRDPEEYLRLHTSHCLDNLRQILMCHVDIGIVGQVWFNPKDPRAFPDFNTRHKCKNFDDIRRWATDRQVPPDDEIPDDYGKVPSPDEVLPADYVITGAVPES
jgi:hypothetical protein